MDASVVIPVGSCDDMLAAQLDALAAQTYPGEWEIVLACNTGDPGQQAALADLAATHPRSRIVDASDVRSAAHARNQGAAAAAGDVLAFCDGDDLVEPGWLEALVGSVDDMTAAGGHLEEELLGVDGQQHWRPPATPGTLPTFMGHAYPVSANMAMGRDLFERIGGFDVSLVRCEDIAIGFRIHRHGAELKYVREAVVHYRHRAGLRSMLHQHYLYGRGMAQVLRQDGLPDGASVGALRPNGQPVDRWTIHQVLRKGALALGRLQGATIDRWRS